MVGRTPTSAADPWSASSRWQSTQSAEKAGRGRPAQARGPAPLDFRRHSALGKTMWHWALLPAASALLPTFLGFCRQKLSRQGPPPAHRASTSKDELTTEAQRHGETRWEN